MTKSNQCSFIVDGVNGDKYAIYTIKGIPNNASLIDEVISLVKQLIIQDIESFPPYRPPFDYKNLVESFELEEVEG